jgi:hypothetical protein
LIFAGLEPVFVVVEGSGLLLVVEPLLVVGGAVVAGGCVVPLLDLLELELQLVRSGTTIKAPTR